jgi:hypothetical protein
VLVEVDLGGVLVEPRCDLVLGLFDCEGVDMVDLLADLVVFESKGRSGEDEIVFGEIVGAGGQFTRINRLGQFRHDGSGAGFESSFLLTITQRT